MHARSTTAIVLALATLSLAGCAPSESSGAESSGAIGDPPSAEPGTLTVTNCGIEVSFDSPPERVVTIKSSTTEALLALGLGDRIVGTAFQDGPVPDKWADVAADIPVLADRVPGQEVVLEASPDLVFAGWESNFSADGAGARADLAALGVDTYVSPSACQSAGQPQKLRFENIFADLEELAAIFRVDASELIAEQRATLDDIEPTGDGRTALWFSSGSDTPFVGAGIGAPQLLLETVGLENIAGGIDATWAPFNWESVVDANPDVIVLVDAVWNSAEKKIGVLESNPATANLDAVKHSQYLVIPFPASEAGVRSAAAAADLARQLEELD